MAKNWWIRLKNQFLRLPAALTCVTTNTQSLTWRTDYEQLYLTHTSCLRRIEQFRTAVMEDNIKDKRQSCDLFSNIQNFYPCAATTYYFFSQYQIIQLFFKYTSESIPYKRFSTHLCKIVFSPHKSPYMFILKAWALLVHTLPVFQYNVIPMQCSTLHFLPLHNKVFS